MNTRTRSHNNLGRGFRAKQQPARHADYASLATSDEELHTLNSKLRPPPVAPLSMLKSSAVMQPQSSGSVNLRPETAVSMQPTLLVNLSKNKKDEFLSGPNEFQGENLELSSTQNEVTSKSRYDESERKKIQRTPQKRKYSYSRYSPQSPETPLKYKSYSYRHRSKSYSSAYSTPKHHHRESYSRYSREHSERRHVSRADNWPVFHSKKNFNQSPHIQNHYSPVYSRKKYRQGSHEIDGRIQGREQRSESSTKSVHTSNDKQEEVQLDKSTSSSKTRKSGADMTTSEFQDAVIKSLAELIVIGKSLVELVTPLSENSKSHVQIEKNSKNLSLIPLKSKEDLEALNNELKNDKVKKDLVKAIQGIVKPALAASADGKSCCRSVLRAIFCDELRKTMCYVGQSKVEKFGLMQYKNIPNLICDAVHLCGFSSFELGALKDVTSNWLKKLPPSLRSTTSKPTTSGVEVVAVTTGASETVQDDTTSTPLEGGEPAVLSCQHLEASLNLPPNPEGPLY